MPARRSKRKSKRSELLPMLPPHAALDALVHHALAMEVETKSMLDEGETGPSVADLTIGNILIGLMLGGFSEEFGRAVSLVCTMKSESLHAGQLMQTAQSILKRYRASRKPLIIPRRKKTTRTRIPKAFLEDQ